MLLHLFIPIIYLALSILTFHFALHSPQQSHRYCLLPIFLLFAILAITSSTYFIWIPGLPSLWIQAIVLNILHVTSLLCIRQWPAPSAPKTPASTHPLAHFCSNLKTSYRLWSNPQLINISPSDSRKNTTTTNTNAPPSTIVFLISRALKLPLYYLLNTKLLPHLLSILFPTPISPADLAPTKQILLRRLSSTTTRDLLIRSYTSLLWIYQSLVYLDGANALLACVFVATGFDRPADWPPLFGNPAAITSLRTFWSRFWHQVALKPYVCIAGTLARGLSVQRHSTHGKFVVAFVVFALSGASHALVSWRIGRNGWTDVYWFMLNFLACLGETVLRSALGRSEKLRSLRDGWLAGLIGRVWVFAFFFWSVPKWQYPAMHKDAVRARQMAVWQAILSKMTVHHE
jgi:hypothetical protein